MSNYATTEIHFDSSDWNGMTKLMDEYGDSDMPFFGKNTEGENTMTSICEDKIVHVTHQNNGWTRTNIYYRDGMTEELFER